MMKRLNLVVIVAAVVVLFSITYVGVASPANVKTLGENWEYADVFFRLTEGQNYITVDAPTDEEAQSLQAKMESSENPGVITFSNIMGNAGWELVTKDYDNLGNWDLVFKRPVHKVPLLSKTSYYLPQDGVPNSNGYVGPFCCTGRTATIYSTANDILGYIYFFDWDGQAQEEGPYVSFAPTIKVKVSSLTDLSDLASGQTTGSIDFDAKDMLPGAFRSSQVGGLTFTVVIGTAPLATLDNKKYFNMQATTIRVDVSTTPHS
jgi:hypothetical protein